MFKKFLRWDRNADRNGMIPHCFGAPGWYNRGCARWIYGRECLASHLTVFLLPHRGVFTSGAPVGGRKGLQLSRLLLRRPGKC